MKNEEITQIAQDHYEHYFKTHEEHPQDRGEDIMVDQEKISEDVDHLKQVQQHRHASLEVLRAKINDEAKRSYYKTFQVKDHEKQEVVSDYQKTNEENKLLKEKLEEYKKNK